MVGPGWPPLSIEIMPLSGPDTRLFKKTVILMMLVAPWPTTQRLPPVTASGGLVVGAAVLGATGVLVVEAI